MTHPYRIDPEAGIVYGLTGRPFATKGNGYVTVGTNGRTVARAHRLIWEHVHGPIPEGMQINHINGIKSDNRIANLELVTPLGNMQHASASGLIPECKGDRNGNARLSTDDVIRIRSLDLPREEIAREYGITPGHVEQIVTGRRWGHVAQERVSA